LNQEANMTETRPDGYLALPKSNQGTGILVFHAWWGLNAFSRDLCKRLARGGFVAFAPDLYIGFSLGAYYALGLSIERPEVICAVVAFYGTRAGDYCQSQAAYLCHFAETDEWVAASGVKKLDKALLR
jgi:dienelactone hydrolase